MFLGDGPIASNITFDYKIKKKMKSSIQLTLDKNVIDQINSATDNYQSKRLAFVYEGEVFFAPKVRGELLSDKVEMTFTSAAAAERVEEVLNSSVK